MLVFHLVTGCLVMLLCIAVAMHALSAVPLAFCDGEIWVGFAMVFVAALVGYLAFVFGHSAYTAFVALQGSGVVWFG